MEKDAVHYDQYTMKPEEFILNLLGAMGFLFAVGMIFYDHLILSGLLSLLALLYMPYRKKAKIRQRREMLNLQFKDALYFISVALSAGKSIETAMLDAHRSLKGIYADDQCDMVREMDLIHAKISMGTTVEQAFSDLAMRSGVEDIKSFADVFLLSKRSGANLVDVIRHTSATIREKIEVRQEIDTIIAGKKLEQRVLAVTPFVMVFIIKHTSDDFLTPLFTTLPGRVVMSIALGMIAAAWLIAQKIMNIQV